MESRLAGTVWRNSALRASVALIATASAVAMLAACSPAGSPSPTGSGSADCQTVKIGGQEPTSGTGASAGTYYQNGLILGVAAVNNAGGFTVNGQCYKFDLENVDNQTDPAKAVSANQKFVSEGIKFIFGPSTTALLAPSFAQVAGTDTMVFGIGAKTNTLQKQPGGDYLFAPNMAQSQLIETDIKATVAKYPNRKVAVLISNDDAGNLLYGYLTAALKDANADVVYDQKYDPSARDFSAYITAMRSAGADLVVGPYLDQWFQPLLQQAATAGWTDPVFVGLNGITSASYNNQIKHFIFFPGSLPVSDPNSTLENVKKFRDLYATQFGAPPPADSGGDNAATLFEPVRMLAKAMSIAGSVDDVAAITKALTTPAAADYPDRIIDLTFDANRESQYPLYLGVIENGTTSYVPTS